jgi:hypothetical protein
MPFAFELPWARQSSAPHIEVPTVDLPQVDLAGKVQDTKRAVSDGADTLSAAAQDLGNQAANLGREAVRLGQDAAKIGRDAAKKGRLWAATGTETLRKLQSDASGTFDDLRSIRVVRERPQGPDWKPGAALIAGAGAGIAAMWFLDPEHGRRRRVLFMDQVHRYARAANAWMDDTARDLRNRSQGWANEARKASQSMRAQTTDYETSDVSATPDVGDKLAATDWTEAEPATTETYRS